MATGPNPSGAGRRLMLGAAIWVLGGCLQSEPDDKFVGSGTELGNVMGILNSPDRKAAAGVEVLLYPLDDSSTQSHVLRTTTNAEGAFAFQVVEGAFRLLALDGAGNGVTVDSLFPAPSDTINLQEIALAPLGGIQGVVKSHPSDAWISLLGTPFDTTFPGDADFLWEGIPAGKYWLQARQGAGMTGPNSRQIVVSVAPGTVTVLSDTLDLTTITLELLSTDLPYRLFEGVRPLYDLPVDSTFCVLNGVRLDADSGRTRPGMDITLTESMLDSTRANILQLYVWSGDSLFVARKWSITWVRTSLTKWAYQAVRAVILSMEPDGRPAARRPGVQGGNPQLGTFRVLEKRTLSPEELEYWQWPAEAGGEASAPDSFRAAVYNIQSLLPRSCGDFTRPPPPNLPGDTVTFFLLPDSILGAVAFRLRTDERFQDLDRLGYFPRADWPLGAAFDPFRRREELKTAFLPEAMRIEWPWPFMFRGSEPRCLAVFRRFHVDSTGKVREMVAIPPGLDSSRLLLHFRANVGNSIDTDSLPSQATYVYIDSSGQGVSGNPDSTRQFQLSAGALLELKNLLSGLPDPIPADWHREHFRTVWVDGSREMVRYLVSDQRGALHITDHPEAAAAKADLFTSVELWLRGQSLL